MAHEQDVQIDPRTSESVKKTWNVTNKESNFEKHNVHINERKTHLRSPHVISCNYANNIFSESFF